MISLTKLKETGYFSQKKIKQGEILFSEGEIDGNLYIIFDGELEISKEVDFYHFVSKRLGRLGIGNVIGEGAFSRNEGKEVTITATRDTTLLSLDIAKDFEKFTQEYPKIAYNLLINIIDLTNKRLLRSNEELTSNYLVSKAIAEIQKISIKEIIELLDLFQKILHSDQIIFFEKNQVMDEYFKIRYDSHIENEESVKILKFPESQFKASILRSNGTEIYKHYLVIELVLTGTLYGYIVVSREKKDFHENEKKILQNIATNFVGLIRQKEILEEERNKSYLKNSVV